MRVRDNAKFYGIGPMKEVVDMGRVFNFSAGPAVLPEEVLREAAEEMLDYKGCGMSVMEMLSLIHI